MIATAEVAGDAPWLYAGRSRVLSTLAGPSAAPSGPLAPYTALVSRGRLLPDDSQLSAAQQLERFATGADSTDGVYLWGSVGSGKTLLMDLFVGSCDNHPAAAVSRWHFHELMLDIHGRLHAMQAARPRKIVRTKLGLPVYKYLDEEEPKSAIKSDERAEDAAASDGEATAEAAAEETAPPSKASVPLERVIAQLASQSRILCLDEFQVTDVADAMLLRQLFEGLFDAGVKVIFTSNRPPEDLYERGLNRAYFIPFVELLRERCAVVRVGGCLPMSPRRRLMMVTTVGRKLLLPTAYPSRLADTWRSRIAQPMAIPASSPSTSSAAASRE